MSQIRNACVARGARSTTGAFFAYTVPASSALILKSIIVYNTHTAAQTVEVDLNVPSVLSVPILYQSINASVALVWSGWTALNAGDRLVISPSLGPCSYWFAGAVLPYNAAPAVLEAEMPTDIGEPASAGATAVIYLPEQVAWASTTGTGV